MSTNSEEKFRAEIKDLIVEWYSGCPRAMQFTNNVIKSYKRNFPEDDLIKAVNNKCRNNK